MDLGFINCEDNMSYFLISDTHFFHEKMMLPEYEERPFRDVNHMNETMIMNWNSVVGISDIVIHFGDFAWGAAAVIIPIIARLNGHKMIILGNHDKRSVGWFKRHGFTKVYRNSLTLGNVIFSHRPHEELPEGVINVHGHIHSGKHRPYQLNPLTHRCVCVEQINYTPILLQEVLHDQSDSVLQLLDQAVC